MWDQNSCYGLKCHHIQDQSFNRVIVYYTGCHDLVFSGENQAHCNYVCRSQFFAEESSLQIIYGLHLPVLTRDMLVCQPLHL
jgi:hypothetical protein